MRFIGLVVIVWLSAGTIAVTVIAGPLNYFGANPKVTNCHVLQPS